MRLTPDDFVNEWAGVPHIYDGREKDGIDCYGLVRRFYNDVLEIVIPDWKRADHSRAWVMRLMSDMTQEYIDWLEQPKPNCIAVGRRAVGAWHMGVFIRNGVFHVMEGGYVHWSPIQMALIEFGGQIRYGYPHG